MRLDSTAAAVYHDPERGTLFRHGHSKDHWLDLAQFKIMLGALDPMGMPLVTLVLLGHKDDDELYLPAIKRVRPVVGQGGRLYIGDSKMADLSIRAYHNCRGVLTRFDDSNFGCGWTMARVERAGDCLKENC